MDHSGLRYGQIGKSCKRGNKPSSSTKREEFHY